YEARVVGEGELLHHDGGVEEVPPGAAVGGLEPRAEEAGPARLVPRLPVDHADLLPALLVGLDLPFDETPEGLPEERVLLPKQVPLHKTSSIVEPLSHTSAQASIYWRWPLTLV